MGNFHLTARLVMSRYDRAVLRSLAVRGDIPEGALGGIEISVHPWMQEGFAAAFDGLGNLLGILDVRPDHARVKRLRLAVDA